MVEGMVTTVVDFGAFVRLEEGVEGLIHISELAEGNFLHPRNVVHENDTVRVRVLSIDVTHRRLGLSLRQAHNGYACPSECHVDDQIYQSQQTDAKPKAKAKATVSEPRRRQLRFNLARAAARSVACC